MSWVPLTTIFAAVDKLRFTLTLIGRAVDWYRCHFSWRGHRALKTAEAAFDRGQLIEATVLCEQARRHLHPDHQSWTDLLCTEARLLILQGQWAEAHRRCQEVLRRCEGLRFRHGQAMASSIEADLFLRQDEPEHAERYLTAAQEMAPEHDYRLRADLLRLQARLFSLRNQGRRATDALRSARDLHGRANNTIGVALTLRDEGNQLLLDGDYEGAEDKYREALALCPRHECPLARAEVLRSQAEAMYRRGHLRPALERLLESAGLYRACGVPISEAYTLWTEGKILITLGRYESAVMVLQEAAGLLRTSGQRQFQAYVLIDLSRVLRMQGHLPAAESAAGEALAIFLRTGDRRGEANARLRCAEAALWRGQLDSATANAGFALQVMREVGDRLGEAEAHCILGDIHAEHGSWDQADLEYNRAEKLFTELKGGDNSQAHLDILLRQARVCQHRGQWSEASARYGRVERAALTAENKCLCAEAKLGRAGVFLLRHHPARALEELDQAESLFHEVGEAMGLARTWSAKALAEAAQGHCDVASTLQARAHEAFVTCGADTSAAELRRQLGPDSNQVP